MKYNVSSFVWCIIFGFLLNGCVQEIPKSKIRIFDFQSFFDKQINILNSTKTGVNKAIIDKENVYSNIDQSPDWKKELSVFKTFALIKPEQEIAYTVDTLRSERGFVFITYSAENSKLKLQLAEVMFNPDKQVEKITLVVKSEEKINSSDITLTYLPLKGYDIKGEINSKVVGNGMVDIHSECLN